MPELFVRKSLVHSIGFDSVEVQFCSQESIFVAQWKNPRLVNEFTGSRFARLAGTTGVIGAMN